MTTQIEIKNRANSNGDVGIVITQQGTRRTVCLAPGEMLSEWIGGHQTFELTEFHPSKAPPASPSQVNGQYVIDDVLREMIVQLKMWGADRADNQSDELIGASIASAAAIHYARLSTSSRENCFADAKSLFYPRNWSPDAFRDYGSDYANLAVAAAYLLNQMLIMRTKGEDMTRSKRGEPYVQASPRMSAVEAGAAR